MASTAALGMTTKHLYTKNVQANVAMQSAQDSYDLSLAEKDIVIQSLESSKKNSDTATASKAKAVAKLKKANRELEGRIHELEQNNEEIREYLTRVIPTELYNELWFHD
ncbi:MAG: hypothetical protein GQ570_04035 [Helicobacteraceae bacterium]|nr:hypothetical protein [Helicobacteraceae bacterium]